MQFHCLNIFTQKYFYSITLQDCRRVIYCVTVRSYHVQFVQFLTIRPVVLLSDQLSA